MKIYEDHLNLLFLFLIARNKYVVRIPEGFSELQFIVLLGNLN